jgi:hypothetical protein
MVVDVQEVWGRGDVGAKKERSRGYEKKGESRAKIL